MSAPTCPGCGADVRVDPAGRFCRNTGTNIDLDRALLDELEAVTLGRRAAHLAELNAAKAAAAAEQDRRRERRARLAGTWSAQATGITRGQR